MPDTFLHNRFRELSVSMEPIDTNTNPSLTILHDIRVIAYDFYGTLFISGVGDIGIDDGSPDAELFLDVLNQSGVQIHNEQAGSLGFIIYNEVVDDMISTLKRAGVEYPEPDIREVWGKVLQKMQSDSLISYQANTELYEQVSVEFEARMNPVWPMPDVTDTLHHFKAKGVTQGIISNSQFYTPVVLEALTNQTLSELGFDENLLNWSYEEKLKKPGLKFYREFLEKLGHFDASIKPHQVLYIGNDMLKDVYPAAELGMRTALFAGDERSLKWRKDDDRCRNLKPDLVITRLSQLIDCVAV
ncbi:MAG: HAD hydrolase-like protein [Balneolaceae bacterium]|nr:HAD hydrolase-like protein [Balneolaceae bacterium]